MHRRLLSGALVNVTVASALAFALANGCSADDKPPISNGFVANDKDAAVGFTGDAGGSPCDRVTVDGGPCGCSEISFLTDVPNLYFVLDRSGSMLDNGKFGTVRQVVADVVQKLGPRASFGVALFSDPSGQSCDPGKQVMPVMQGDSPAGTAGITTHDVIATTNVVPFGGTPTAATIVALAPAIEKLTGRTFVILATDGAPNCNYAATCDADHCIANIEGAMGCPVHGPPNCCTGAAGAQSNCLDEQPTVDAVAALKSAGILTYVIGIPGSAPYASVLDHIATAGGTARAAEPLYYDVTSTDPAPLEAALAQIAAKITATCVFPLSPAPADPRQLNIYFDDVVVPQDPTNGWSYDATTTTLTLTGTACQKVMDGEILNLRVIAGCPTVTPR
ncbi:MAG: vWA domain-containing protein [Polyangiaceae bacterium]